MESVAEVLSPSFPSTVMDWGCVGPASCSAYDPGQNATHWHSHLAFDPLGALWPTPSDQRPLFPLVNQESSTLWHHSLAQLSVHPSVYSSHATHSHYPSLPSDENVTEPSIPHSPPYRSFRPILSRRRRAARAIEYDGLWIDEEELLKGLTEPDGKLIVHQCCWEEDNSPCPLWIRGDKSSINAHIQKWHGGKPGGDKFQVDCRWSACGKSMLKESIARHIVTTHLGEVWECQGCGKEVVRNDAYGRHAERSGFAACRASGALITYSVDAREIDARAALDSGGRLWYAVA